MRQAVMLAMASLAMLGATKPAPPKAPYSAIYCQREPHNGHRYFAAKEQPDGKLLFGVSHWFPNGAASGTYGLATRDGDHWIFTAPPSPYGDPGAEGCTVRIWIKSNGVPIVRPDKVNRCPGGYGMYLDVVTFERRAFYRAVTHELDDAEAFEGWAVCGDYSG